MIARNWKLGKVGIGGLWAPRSENPDLGHPEIEACCAGLLAEEFGDGGDYGLLLVFAEFGEDGER